MTVSDADHETTGADREGGLGDLLEDATDAFESLEAQLGDVDSLDDLPGDVAESILGDVETLADVVTELEDVLDALDVGELREAIDTDELLASIDIEEVPDALTREDAGLDDVVNVTHLVKAFNLLDAWDAAELGHLWEEARELGDAVDDLAEDENGGVLGAVASGVVGDDGEDGDGLLEELGDDLGEMDVDPTEALGSIDLQSDPEVYQVFIQQQAMRGIDEFRDALLRVHGKFERLYEYNRERMRRQDRGTNSRNPTAVSTMPVDRRDLGGSARYSTVPRQVRHSNAPTRNRIYGERFELERKRRGYD